MAIDPITREERFLAAAGGQNVTTPEPITRKEYFLQGVIDAVKSGGNGSGGVSTKRHYGTFSVLGDSYSTFVGFVTPNDNLCWYPAGNASATGSNNDVANVEEMWWHIFATTYESALQVNNAYSGSPICYNGWGDGETDSAETGFIARSNNIGTPELIFVFGGSNDDWVNASIGEYKYADWAEADFVAFRPAMAYLLNYLKQHNAGARIIFVLNEGLDTAIDESVLTICNHYNVDVVELSNIETSNGHPTVAGQASIAQQLVDFLSAVKVTGISASISKTDFLYGVTLDEVKRYITVTATYDDGSSAEIKDYTLSGAVTAGTNTLTVTYGTYTDTVQITVTKLEVEVTSIEATLSQTEFAEGVTLDDLKSYLTVTAHYEDGTSEVVTDYELSGNLAVGTNTITVSYAGASATVTATVTKPYKSNAYRLSVETPEASDYQYYCPVFNNTITSSVRIVFDYDFALFSNNLTLKTNSSYPTRVGAGAEFGRTTLANGSVDVTYEGTTTDSYFFVTIGSAGLKSVILENFHVYVDGVEVEPVGWIGFTSTTTITAEKLA